MLIIGFTAFLLNHLWPFYRLLASGGTGRVESIDGFRGLLATGVFIHHFFVIRNYLKTGVWEATDSHLFAFLGPGAVSFFFMLTGFLFWSRAINDRLTTKSLLRSRFWRIMPLYWFSTVLIVIAALSVSGWQIRVGPLAFCISLARWSAGGLLGSPDINAVPTLTINAGVTWTLCYEWMFYLSLPLLMGLAKPARFALLSCVFFAVLLAAKVNGWSAVLSPMSVSSSFLGGMASAYLVRNRLIHRYFGSRHFSWCVPPLLLAALFTYKLNKTAANFLFLLPVFVSVACGCTVFGLLKRPWLTLLGHVSYSVYLLHAIVLTQAVRVSWIAEKLQGDWSEWFPISAGFSVAVVVVSAITYRCIEHPFLRTSRPETNSRAS
jgi:peptidoglycan/LPS O-acetylase OafA/YrhL